MADDIINALQQANRSASVLQGIANPPQINPLAAITAGNQAAQAEFATRKMQADQAAGRAFLNSIDPNTGQPNQAALMRNLQADPTTAFAAQRSAQEGQTLDTGTFNLHNAKLQGVSASLSELLSRYPGGVPAEAAHDLIRREAALGNMPPELATQLSGQFGNDPHENSKNITQLLFRNLNNQQILQQTYGDTFRQTGLGGNTIGATQAPARFGGGVSTPAGQAGAPTGMDAGQYGQYQQWLLEKVDYPDPTDPTKTKNATRATMLQDLHVDPRQVWPGALQGAVPPAGTSGGTPSVTPPAAPRGTTTRSSFPPPPPGVVAPAAPAPAPAPAPAAPFGTGTGASTPTAGTVKEVEGSVQHATDARARTLTYQRDIQPIEGAITALSGADTGRASEALNSLRANIQDIAPAFLQRMLPTSLTDPKARQAFEEANKYLTAMQLAAPGGSRSDAGAATAGAANPNVHISNAAAREVALAILAQRRMEHAGTILFNQSGKPGGDFDKHMGEWNTAADPRAFVVDQMTPGERQAYVKGLGGTDTPAYQQYKKSYMDAVTSGVSPPPR